MLKQVLTLKPLLNKDETLNEERRLGSKNLDFTFKCYGVGVVGHVLAHRSVVVAYSPELKQLCHIAARSGLPKSG